MKKWWAIIAAAASCIGVAMVLRPRADVVTVKTVTLQPQSVEQTVSCNGVVESKTQQVVTVDIPCVISKVLVEEGQSVKVGDVLAEIDSEATRAAAQNATERLTLSVMDGRILSTVNGVVVDVPIKAGATLERQSPCAVVAPDEELQVRIAIREKHLPVLKVGMPVRISGDGFRQGHYKGVLSDISSAARTTAAGDTVVEGVVTLTKGQADESMRLGLTAKAAVVVTAADGVLVVPYEAVREDEGGGEYVYVVENGIAHRRMLTVEKEVSNGVLLADTAMQGVKVVTQPELISRDGMAVYTDDEVLQ